MDTFDVDILFRNFIVNAPGQLIGPVGEKVNEDKCAVVLALKCRITFFRRGGDLMGSAKGPDWPKVKEQCGDAGSSRHTSSLVGCIGGDPRLSPWNYGKIFELSRGKSRIVILSFRDET